MQDAFDKEILMVLHKNSKYLIGLDVIEDINDIGIIDPVKTNRYFTQNTKNSWPIGIQPHHMGKYRGPTKSNCYKI